jgi:hypothetical protein
LSEANLNSRVARLANILEMKGKMEESMLKKKGGEKREGEGKPLSGL